tara:strand:+ start:2190 stop:2627 length:438 start_codon:yes stop_codon:yes gene_type:complete
MLLEELLGPRVKTKSSQEKQDLTPKEVLVLDIDNQLLLLNGNKPPVKYLKKNGKICKNKEGRPKKRRIKSWFSSDNQFKPTPNGITFFQGDKNCFNIGSHSKVDVLTNFKDEIIKGSYDSEIELWYKLCEARNSRIKKSKMNCSR